MLETELPFPMPNEALMKVEGISYRLVKKGKVREVFDMGDAYLMVATDRVSAFDVIMNEGLAGILGVLLTQISLFFVRASGRSHQHHLVDNHASRLKELSAVYPDLEYRSRS